MSRQHLSRSLDLKPAPPDPKLAALYGPIDLKVPGSEEWIIQLTARAVRLWMSLTEDTKSWRDAVARLDAEEVWKKYPKEKPYGTRDAFYRGEMGAPEPELTLLKEAQQLQKNGGDRRSQAFQETQQLQHHGGEQKPANQSSNTRLKPVSKRCDTTYIRARLERDGKTALLDQIERGEISAHAAAVKAGIRHRMISLRPTVQGFLSAALAHLSPEQRLELKESLHKSPLKDICDGARPSKSGDLPNDFCRELLLELLRRRKEIHDKNAKGRWLPENVSKLELTMILDWVQQELETFNGGQSVDERKLGPRSARIWRRSRDEHAPQ
jgi:hypothetical protein